MNHNRYFYVYIMASESGVLYIGITNNIARRSLEHKLRLCKGLSQRYATTKLVYYETFRNVIDAIAREKQIKKWRRQKKIHLIEQENANWHDLAYMAYSDFLEYNDNFQNNKFL